MKTTAEIPLPSNGSARHPIRASWKGYLRIGDLMIPVLLFGVTRSTTPRFTQLHAVDHAPVRRVTLCSKDGEQLTENDIVRAVEYAGKYVELSDDELERHSDVERDIIIRQITLPENIDPIYYDTPYYIVTDKGGELAYSIVRRAFEQTGKSAIATFMFYGRERLAVISSKQDILHLQTLRFQEDILPRGELRTPSLPQPSPAQVAVAAQLLDRYTMPFHASDYRDQQTDALNALLERKAAGLPLKKSARIASSATPEDQVIAKMKRLLAEDPKALHR